MHERARNAGLVSECSLPTRLARADKIAHLRHAVENGDYCVGPEQIAEKMMQEALVEMFTS